jgi:hypothetical protein
VQSIRLRVAPSPAAKNGQIIVWQNGKEIFNLSHPNLNTLHSKVDYNTDVYWEVGNYVSKESSGKQLLYIDDVMITDHRVY